MISLVSLLVVVGVLWQLIMLERLQERLRRLESRIENLQAPDTRSRPPPAAMSDNRLPAQPDLHARAFLRIKRYFSEGNLIVRLGVIVLFCGLAFLLDYAADYGMLPVELRLLGVAAAGVALLLLGWRLRLQHPAYALALQGGAIALLYLTVFTAFRMYDLLSVWAAFPLLLVLGAAAAVLSIRQNAVALAVLGISGGFLAPAEPGRFRFHLPDRHHMGCIALPRCVVRQY
jgi:uncharacterized membrane protein